VHCRVPTERVERAPSSAAFDLTFGSAKDPSHVTATSQTPPELASKQEYPNQHPSKAQKLLSKRLAPGSGQGQHPLPANSEPAKHSPEPRPNAPTPRPGNVGLAVRPLAKLAGDFRRELRARRTRHQFQGSRPRLSGRAQLAFCSRLRVHTARTRRLCGDSRPRLSGRAQLAALLCHRHGTRTSGNHPPHLRIPL
jgi:hypothetical protein